MVNQKLLKFFYYPDLIIIELKFGLKTSIGKKNVLSLKF